MRETIKGTVARLREMNRWRRGQAPYDGVEPSPAPSGPAVFGGDIDRLCAWAVKRLGMIEECKAAWMARHPEKRREYCFKQKLRRCGVEPPAAEITNPNNQIPKKSQITKSKLQKQTGKGVSTDDTD